MIEFLWSLLARVRWVFQELGLSIADKRQGKCVSEDTEKKGLQLEIKVCCTLPIRRSRAIMQASDVTVIIENVSGKVETVNDENILW